jgi:hypothetical protein
MLVSVIVAITVISFALHYANKNAEEFRDSYTDSVLLENEELKKELNCLRFELELPSSSRMEISEDELENLRRQLKFSQEKVGALKKEIILLRAALGEE